MKTLRPGILSLTFLLLLVACSSGEPAQSSFGEITGSMDQEPGGLTDAAAADIQPGELPAAADVAPPDGPVDDMLVPDLPLEDVPIPDVPLEDIPLEDIPLEDIPLEDIPLEDIPLEDIPLEDIPLEDIPPVDIAPDEVCVPDCAGKECGDDGCGGLCGECMGCDGVAPDLCYDGICADVCCPDCQDKECGDDGCGGSCGQCPEGACFDGSNPFCNGGTCECLCQDECEAGEVACNAAGTAWHECINVAPDCDQWDTFTPCEEGLTCLDGACVCVPSCAGKECGDDGCGGSCGECDDDSVCTDDACGDDGQCVFAPISCDDNDPCTEDTCDSVTGCQYYEISCDDDNACTDDACDLNIGGCVNQAIVCDDHDPTTEDSCNPATGCIYTPKVCDDGNPCTQDSVHPMSGDCVFEPKSCDDSNPCTTDSCNPATGECSNIEIDCEDGSSCTGDYCNKQTGECVHPGLNGPYCSNADACDGQEMCVNGVCTPGQPLDCDDADPCTVDSCHKKNGCQYAPAVNGTPCTDQSVCTGADTCMNGQCISGPPVVCNDQNICTNDACNDVTGCEYLPVPDGTACGINPQFQCVDGECACQPACSGKECGPDGCGGSCGTCPKSQTCVQGKCEANTGCAAIINCALGCGYTFDCLQKCSAGASGQSLKLFTDLVQCLLGECGTNPAPMCYILASQGACKAQADACLAN